MSRYDNEVRITLSVLDRLLDYEPDVLSEPPASRAKTLRLFKQAVRRDLELLLNTRQLADGVPENLKEVSNSVLVYGLPDFSSASGENPDDCNRMRRAIADAISAFEPRLRDVTVSVERSNGGNRALRFTIDANLIVDPAPEPVTFDTTLQLISGEYKVSEK